jgi:hypothetical protein
MNTHLIIRCSLSRGCTGTPLHRDADRNSGAGIPPVEQVIAVVDVHHIDVIVVVPVIPPVFWPRVNEAQPIATVLEAGISAHNQKGQSVDAEPMVRSKVSTEPVVRDAIAVIATPLLPSAVVGIPAL